jgi:fructose-bisphosphate aldolase class I
MHQGPALPWALTFSYGRALQQPALNAWNGEAANVIAGQQQLQQRAALNRAAVLGPYDAGMEPK